jgi:leucyl-tRNA synthetase
MHKELILEWIKKQALMLTPVAPHWAEYVWQELLKQVRGAFSVLQVNPLMRIKTVHDYSKRAVPQGLHSCFSGPRSS